MKNNVFKRFTLILVLFVVFTVALIGCGQSDNSDGKNNNSSVNRGGSDNNSDSSIDNSNVESGDKVAVTELEVCFGDEGKPFVMHLYDNDTAAMIARHVGTADWRLPIYHYDDYENYEVMQYYDIPSRYEIPSNPETVTSEKAGEVYYSEPNRIVLFYQDAEVTGEYTKLGYFDYSDEFQAAVENNPVIEGWGNKIVLIRNVD